jgi:hypothetical protein
LRYRTLTPTGDMTFGFGSANFLVNSPQTVQQATVTGLKLFLGEWFLNTSVGMPWNTQVIGNNTQALYDNAAKSQILVAAVAATKDDVDDEQWQRVCPPGTQL